MPKRRVKRRAGPAWLQFSQRHRGDAFLKLDPLYALQEDVIAQIEQSIPNFFTETQANFERDLARTTAHGFFLGRPIGGDEKEMPPTKKSNAFTVPEKPHHHSQAFLAKLRRREKLRLEQIFERLKQPPDLADEMLERLAPPLKPEWYNHAGFESYRKLSDFLSEIQKSGVQSATERKVAWSQARTERRALRRRQEAYAGWLVGNPLFRRELHTLRSTWKSEINDSGEFPSTVRRADRRGTKAAAPRVSRLESEFFAFYCRWGLEGLLTWELPLPVNPQVGISPGYWTLGAEEAGISIFVPWYALRGGLYDLQHAAKRIMSLSAPSHLQDWLLLKGKAKDADAGEKALQRTFWLYRCFFLVLAQRYPTECKRHVQKVDEAMGAVMDRGADLVKKLRQQLARNLRLA
jgi:hypothetical protein